MQQFLNCAITERRLRQAIMQTGSLSEFDIRTTVYTTFMAQRNTDSKGDATWRRPQQ